MGTMFGKWPTVFDDLIHDEVDRIKLSDEVVRTSLEKVRGSRAADAWRGLVFLYELHTRGLWLGNRAITDAEWARCVLSQSEIRGSAVADQVWYEGIWNRLESIRGYFLSELLSGHTPAAASGPASAPTPVASVDAPAKRGPGRPRKNPLPLAPAPVASGDAPVKRGPGRPRKNPLPVASGPVSAPAPVASTHGSVESGEPDAASSEVFDQTDYATPEITPEALADLRSVISGADDGTPEVVEETVVEDASKPDAGDDTPAPGAAVSEDESADDGEIVNAPPVLRRYPPRPPRLRR